LQGADRLESGEKFERRLNAGEIDIDDSPDVTRVATFRLRPLSSFWSRQVAGRADSGFWLPDRQPRHSGAETSGEQTLAFRALQASTRGLGLRQPGTWSGLRFVAGRSRLAAQRMIPVWDEPSRWGPIDLSAPVRN
jgi:hypothetical protein